MLLALQRKYEPIKVLGSGAYGVVISALNKETGEKVAIKKMTVCTNSSCTFAALAGIMSAADPPPRRSCSPAATAPPSAPPYLQPMCETRTDGVHALREVRLMRW